jgi:hypothetical protein
MRREKKNLQVLKTKSKKKICCYIQPSDIIHSLSLAHRKCRAGTKEDRRKHLVNVGKAGPSSGTGLISPNANPMKGGEGEKFGRMFWIGGDTEIEKQNTI